MPAAVDFMVPNNGMQRTALRAAADDEGVGELAYDQEQPDQRCRRV